MIIQKRNNVIYDYEGYQFSRASTAYDDLGRIAGVNNARYSPGKFGLGIRVEEGTTNLLPANKQKFDGWTTYQGSVATITQGQADPYGGSEATRIQTTGGSNWTKYLYTFGAGTIGEKNAYSVWIKNNLDTNVVFSSNQGGSQTITKSQGWVKASLTSTAAGAQRMLLFGTTNSAHDIDIIVYQPQFESKDFATSFTPSVRMPESLTIPTAGILSPTEGQIDVWIYVDAVVRRQGATNNRIFNINRSSGGLGMYLYHQLEAASWRLRIRNDADAYMDISFSDSFTPDGWHLFTIKWSATEAAVLVDGIRRGAVSSPQLPSGFAPNMHIGCDGSTAYLNTLFDDIRIRSEPNSDSDTLAEYSANAPLPVDSKTTLKLDFDGPARRRAAQAIVIGG